MTRFFFFFLKKFCSFFFLSFFLVPKHVTNRNRRTYLYMTYNNNIGNQIVILHRIHTLFVQINDDQEDLQKDLELVLDSPILETSPQEAPVQDTSKSPKPSSSSSSPPEHKESRSHSTSPPSKPDRSQQVLRSLRHYFKLCYSNLHIN